MLRMLRIVAACLLAVGCSDAGTAPVESTGLLAKRDKPPQVNYALDFTTAYVQVADADVLDLSTTFTLEAWVKPHGPGPVPQHIISKWGGGGNASYLIDYSAGRVRAWVHDGVANSGVTSNTTLDENVWQHVAVTFDNGNFALYINGILDATQVGTSLPMVSTQPLNFGSERSLNFTGRFFDGQIDEVRIWNVVLSERQIARQMTRRLRGTERGLVGYWRFDEGEGAVAYDGTKNNLDGTVGGALWTADAAPLR